MYINDSGGFWVLQILPRPQSCDCDVLPQQQRSSQQCTGRYTGRFQTMPLRHCGSGPHFYACSELQPPRAGSALRDELVAHPHCKWLDQSGPWNQPCLNRRTLSMTYGSTFRWQPLPCAQQKPRYCQWDQLLYLCLLGRSPLLHTSGFCLSLNWFSTGFFTTVGAHAQGCRPYQCKPSSRATSQAHGLLTLSYDACFSSAACVPLTPDHNCLYGHVLHSVTFVECDDASGPNSVFQLPSFFGKSGAMGQSRRSQATKLRSATDRERESEPAYRRR